MLPQAHRLHRAADFTEVVRRGRRASRPLLAVHLLVPESAAEPMARAGVEPAAAARAGLVVSKAVGGSVVRHRTARRLRALLRPRLAELPSGARLVVRAAPAAGAAPSSALADDLDAALALALRPRGRQGRRP